MSLTTVFISSVQKEVAVERRALRDFVTNASVQVMLFSDRLEIWNPGELPPPLTMERLRVPHPSIPRNPLIADPLFLARYIEKAGTGTLDMIALFRERGLPEPEFRQYAGIFVQCLRRPPPAVVTVAGTESGSESRSESGSEWWRARSEWRPEWQPESVHQRIMVAIARAPASRSELAAALGHKSITRALRHALSDLMATGLVAYRIPDKPNSRLQHYRGVRSTDTGREKAQKAQNRKPMPDIMHLCDTVRETAFAIHKYHRHGHLEKVYENALAHRLRKLGLDVKQQHPLTVHDEDGTVIGEYLADLYVDNRLIIELKAAKALADEHIAQILGYLRAARIEHGLLVNFGAPKFEIRKFVLSQPHDEHPAGKLVSLLAPVLSILASLAPFRG